MSDELLKDPESLKKSRMIALIIGALIPFLGVGIYAYVTGFSGRDARPTAEVDWLLLRELDLQTGRPSDRLASFDGKQVTAPGFMVPLEDNRSEVTEFLLVPNPQACIHAPPPPSNQMVYVRMVKGPAKMIFGPVQVDGTLRISSQTHQYGSAGFQMYGDLVSPYKE